MRNFVNFLRTPFLQNTSLNISLNHLYFYKIVSPLRALPRLVSLNHRGINMEGVTAQQHWKKHSYFGIYICSFKEFFFIFHIYFFMN